MNINDNTFAGILSVMHNVRYGGLPTHYPSIASWDTEFSQNLVLKALKKLPSINMPIGVYVHIPFCATKCSFCFLNTWMLKNENSAKEYVSALVKEIEITGKYLKGKEVKSIYIGGGTPNILKAEDLRFLFKKLNETFNPNGKANISIEVNPKFLSFDKLKVLKNAGVDLIMVGVQSLNDKVIKNTKRSQDSKKIGKIIADIRKAQIKYINVDLLCGLKNQDKKDFLKDIVFLASLGVDHFHLNRYKPVSGVVDKTFKETLKSIQNLGIAALIKRGYKRVDEDSLSLSPKEMNFQGNTDFQIKSSIIGLGAGAMSHVYGAGRHQNISNPQAYIDAVNQKRGQAARWVKLTLKQEMVHYVLDKLSHEEIVSEKTLLSLFGRANAAYMRKKLSGLKKLDLVKKTSVGWYIEGEPQWFQINKALYEEKYLLEVARRYKIL